VAFCILLVSISLHAPASAGAHDADAAPRPAGAGAPAVARDPSGVRVINALGQPSVREAVRELLDHRDLLFQLAARDVRIRYKQAVMGFAWAVLMPLLVVGAGTLVRVAVVTMAGMKLEVAEIGSVALKSFPWAFFAGALGFAVNSVTNNLSLVTKIYFPRAVLPLAAVGANLLDLAVGAAVLVVALPFLGAQLSAALLWVPLLLVLLVLVAAGLGVILACANLFFRDVKYIVSVVLTFGIFFTPVLFDAVTFGAKGARVMALNPLTPIFEGLRLAVFQGHNLLEPATAMVRGAAVVAWEPWYLAYATVWAVGSLALGLVLFQRTQYLFAEYA
jgi:ABC-type polysaccharide/polyol phosphate export permease